MYVAVYVPRWCIRAWLWVRRLFRKKDGIETVGWYYLGHRTKLLVGSERIIKWDDTR